LRRPPSSTLFPYTRSSDLEHGAQLVEVLPYEEYQELHLPGAVPIPLKELDAEHARRLDRDRPVIVYCWDALCDMSPRAAAVDDQDRKSTRLNSSHVAISYA